MPPAAPELGLDFRVGGASALLIFGGNRCSLRAASGFWKLWQPGCLPDPGQPATMHRSMRNKKPVNYSQSLDSDYDDDDDFAPRTATSNKKSKITKETKREKQEKSKSKNSHKELSPLQVNTPHKRMALDDKLYKRDLEVALALSVKEPSVTTAAMQKSQDVEKCDSAESEKVNISPYLSNCSIDGVCFNLNKITEENDSHAGHRPRKASSKVMIQQRKSLRETSEGDNTDSEPDFTSESNSYFSESEGEDDEDFTTRKSKAKENKERNAKIKTPVKKEEKKPSKSSNSLAKPVISQSTLESKPAPKEPCLSSKLVRNPLQTLSPLGESKKPRWVPPASSGSSNSNHLGGVSVKSPSHSLRLGLSRYARVKPLHPAASSTNLVSNSRQVSLLRLGAATPTPAPAGPNCILNWDLEGKKMEFRRLL